MTAVAALVAILILAYSLSTVPGRATTTSSTEITSSNTSSQTLPPGTVQYTTNSPSTGQWLVVRFESQVLSVASSNTGTIPVQPSMASLNETTIGYVCQSVGTDGACNSEQYLQQTGWYWDSSNSLLYVHYLGGQNVTLTVTEKT